MMIPENDIEYTIRSIEWDYSKYCGKDGYLNADWIKIVFKLDDRNLREVLDFFCN